MDNNKKNLSLTTVKLIKDSNRPEDNLVEDKHGHDWVHPSIYVVDTGIMGLGLVTSDLIPKGSVVILFGGSLMTWSKVDSLPEDMKDIPYQVADDIFFGVLNRSDIGVGERINHSCNPNCGFESEMRLVAIRDILPGETITMDYATCSSMESYRLVCKCGSYNCRKVVTGDDWKSPELQSRLKNFYQPYLKEKLNRQKIKCSSSLKKVLSMFFRNLSVWLSK